MGGTVSLPEDVPSIHKFRSNNPKSGIGQKFGNLGVKGGQVILDNLKDISSAVGPSAAITGKLVSVALVLLFDTLLEEEKMDMKQLLAQIKEAIHDELTEVEVDKVQSTVEGLKRWVRVELQNRKKSTANWSSEDIWKDFYSEVDRIRKDIDLLMSQRFKKSNKGLFIFLHAAPLHLASLWDLAHLDQRVDDWTKSAHYNDLKVRAVEYANHAETAMDILLKQREEKVELHERQRARSNVLWKSYWEDKMTQQCGEWEYLGKTSYDKRVKAVKENLRIDLGKPTEVAKYWRRIVTEEPVRPNDGIYRN